MFEFLQLGPDIQMYLDGWTADEAPTALEHGEALVKLGMIPRGEPTQ